ncbi:PREDICTED: uncharacterized protein LOC104826385 [Tarenaya hassleriana]|uniref:uncharacterized protein LOC104826385 n=1 Tax=Tarenaya hassleriana TaxID=28532 RepID=UPI00053C4691|nr:PREDICTED: uncharacterized protein LOC104826385 [Tarenaya hassleriana]
MEKMEHEQSSLLSWVYQIQGKTMEELRHSLLYTTLELEQTRIAAREELNAREDQLMELRDLLDKAMKERDEARENCQRLVLDKKLLFQQGVSSTNEEDQDPTRRGNDENVNGFSSSDGEESTVSSFDPPNQILQPLLPQQCLPSSPEMAEIELAFAERPLPEKGKLLMAVMKAGPLLQTLLLAGPLPQWRHPPPQLDSIEIPPVTISPSLQSQLLQRCGNLNRKRVLSNECNSPRETKSQRLVFP